MRTPFIAGNWKMHGTMQSATSLLKALRLYYDTAEAPTCAVFPPFVYLPLCQTLLEGSRIAWGAQNVSNQIDGALTGEISASMLSDLNCRYVIVGHSERRHIFGETSALVALKVQAALHAGLTPVLCVGETEAERDAGKTFDIVQEQLAHVLRLKDNLPALDSMVVAYEPVWAIGTGRVATPEQAETVHAVIRSYCNEFVPHLGDALRIIYGGSVKPQVVTALSAMPNIDGVLVGGASLHADQFIEIGERWNNW